VLPAVRSDGKTRLGAGPTHRLGGRWVVRGVLEALQRWVSGHFHRLRAGSSPSSGIEWGEEKRSVRSKTNQRRDWKYRAPSLFGE